MPARGRGMAALGVAVRVQRAGNHVLTRPLLLTEDWAANSWDAWQGSVLRDAWRTFAH
ncbi:hypothetical protein [Embleya sp. NPDC005971]|uniref:hypothetical protein n=1 Tax=Embleya sp. NPDC005971 TaxID=3156724 RepID=UPI0033DEE507